LWVSGSAAAAAAVAALLAGVLCGCQHRGPRSPEAQSLMKGAPPAEVAEAPPPTTDAPAPAPAPAGTETTAAPPTEGAKPQAAGPATTTATTTAARTTTAPAPPPPPPVESTRTVTITTAPTTRTTTALAPVLTPATTGAATATMTPTRRRPTGVFAAADADEATRLRNWPISVAYYGNGNVIAGPVYRFIPAEPKSDKYWDRVLLHEGATTALFLPQTLITPFWFLITPPWRSIEYHGEEVPPSYTVDEKVPYYETEKVPGIWVIGGK
jgi:hypothetical protein